MYISSIYTNQLDKKQAMISNPSLSIIKLVLLRTIVVVSMVMYALEWLNESFRRSLLPFDRVTYPLSLTICFMAVTFLFAGSLSRSKLEYIALFVLFLYLLNYIYAIVYVMPLEPKGFIRISATPEWLLLVYGIALLAFDLRMGLIVSLMVYLGLLFYLSISIAQNGYELLNTSTFYVLVRGCVWSVFYIPILSVIAIFREKYIKTVAFAKMVSVAAYVDDLTNIYNRRYLGDMIRQAIAQNNSLNDTFSIIMFDIDHFKQINDRYGHDCGDLVLSRVARSLAKSLRQNDTFGRWGGEEFMVIAPATDLLQAEHLAERLRYAMSQIPHDHIGSVTASFGVATYRPGDTADTLLKRADTALYQAKLNGRNCWVSETSL